MTVPKVSIEASPRSDFGKGAARRLRQDGKVPAVIYGQGTELIHVAIDAKELALILRDAKNVIEVTGAGKNQVVAPRDIQRDPVTQNLEHIDLVVLSAADAAARSK
jgi:large subunit ribosomal protein L25